MEHWGEGHELECKEYITPANVDSAPAVSSERRVISHMGISSSDHHRSRDQRPSTSAGLRICFVCGDWAVSCCSRCKVAKYCSETCQIKHWGEGHELECKEYISPTNIDSSPAISSERRGTSHMGISSSDHHRDRDQKPSTSVRPHICFLCDDWEVSRCSRCKVAKYCSETCQIKHWIEGHNVECEEYKSPTNMDSASAVSSERGGISQIGISSSDHHRDRDEMPATTAGLHICLFCGGRADIRCSRCKVARYCSAACQQKHWRAGHKLECEKYKSPANKDSTFAFSSKIGGTSHTSISSSDHHRDEDKMPSAPAIRDLCFVSGNRSDSLCSRCKVVRYCSAACRLKHWTAGHMLECVKCESPANKDFTFAFTSEIGGTSHTSISSSDLHRDQEKMPSAPAIRNLCFVCGNRSDSLCSRCKVVRYCSAACRLKHWRAGHMLECVKYESPANKDSTFAFTSKIGGTSHTSISSSDLHRDHDKMPSAPAIRDLCFVCGDQSDSLCSRCKVVRYCSAACQMEHWKACQKLEGEEYKTPANKDSATVVSSEGRDTSHMGLSSSDHHRGRMPSTATCPHICLFCGGKADICCRRCKVARYCSAVCQLKHWRARHKLECEEYISPINEDSAFAVSSERRGTSHMGISSSDHHRDKDKMPSAPASRDLCFICGDWSDILCSRCKVVRYCSQACAINHWRAGHELECKVYSSPSNVDFSSAVSSERRGSGQIGVSSSEFQHSKKDGKLPETVQSSKRTSSKELQSVEECPICLSAIHTSEQGCSLLACDICKHEFHSTCLSNWFLTSKKSRCPLCRSPFKSTGSTV